MTDLSRSLRDLLKSGEYDGTDIMRAWIAIDELINLRKQPAPAARVPDGWDVHAKVNIPAENGQRIIGYRVTLPEKCGLGDAIEYLPPLSTPQPPEQENEQ